MSVPVKDPVFFVSGATGTGKSSLAIDLATHLQSEWGYKDVTVVNCDVMQFYKDLPIATNKGPKSTAKQVPHTFLGFLNADDSFCREPETDFYAESDSHAVNSDSPSSSGTSSPFTVHHYLSRVTAFIERYFANATSGAIIVCGGTCYYLQSLILTNMLVDEGVDDAEGKDNKPLTENLVVNDGELWSKLNEIDPESAMRYHPHDTRRLRRLLEIYVTKGEQPSEVFNSRQGSLRFLPERTFLVWTWVNREELNKRLRERVDEMVTEGLVREVRDFREKVRYLPTVGAISEAIGYKEWSTVSDRDLAGVGASPLVAESIERVKNDTIQYARKQERWLANRITSTLDSTTPPLPHHHFVRVDLGSASDKSKIAVALLNLMFSKETGTASSAAFSLPLEAIETTKSPITQEFCDACQMVVCGRDQMGIHLQSKRHRGALKRQKLEREQLEKHGRILPPRKRRKEA